MTKQDYSANYDIMPCSNDNRTKKAPPDVWPRGDIALAASYQRLKQLPERLQNDEMETISEKWAPYRSSAARLLWHYYLSDK